MRTSKDAFLLRGDVGRGEHSAAWNAYTTCCGVFNRIPLCLNYRVCEMSPVSRWSCGATRVYVALWSFTFQIDHGRERRFASFIFPLYIYKDVKIAGYSHRSTLVGDFSADLRASALAMLISNSDLLPERMIGYLSRN